VEVIRRFQTKSAGFGTHGCQYTGYLIRGTINETAVAFIGQIFACVVRIAMISEALRRMNLNQSPTLKYKLTPTPPLACRA
jgi:hypothetical protein